MKKTAFFDEADKFPKGKVYCNVTGKAYKSVDEIYEYLPIQVRECVRFYEIWTAKEAYSKYGVKGFGIDFGSFEVVKKENNFYVFVDRTQEHIVNVRDTVDGYMLSFLCEDEGEISVETEYGGKKYVSICGLFRQYFIFI